MYIYKKMYIDLKNDSPSLVVAIELSGSTCEEEEDETKDMEVVLVVLSCSPLVLGNGDSAEFTISMTTMLTQHTE